MPRLPAVIELLPTLREAGIDWPPGPSRVTRHGDSAELTVVLLELIRAGHKRGRTELWLALDHDKEPLPEAGMTEIVVDHRHRPVLLTRVNRVELCRYDRVTPEHAAIEGEGDGSLTYWRKARWASFSRECARIGEKPSESMLVVCSVFEVLAQVRPGAGPSAAPAG